MPKSFDFGGVNLTAGEDSSFPRPTPETSFRVAILGDFSGRSNRGISDGKTIDKRRAALIDRDNFDEALSRCAPEIQLAMEDSSLHLKFNELDDFHPDHIFRQLDALSKLRDLRGRLKDPSTFTEAAEELGLRSSSSVSEGQPKETPAAIAPSPTRLASGSLLDEMIEQTEARGQDRPKGKPDEVHEFARRVAARHSVAAPDARQPEILKVIDRGIGSLMQAVLHHRDFQALEAIWRATYLLVRQVETGSDLKLHIIDISRDELAADLRNADLKHTGTYRLLVEQTVQTAGAEPWALIVGNYSFGPGDDDAELLSRLSQIADRAGAPFVAEASPGLLGCSSIASSPHPREWEPRRGVAWSELRHRPEAASAGLALPRFLLRLPYGKKTSQTEAFDFEEFQGLPAHDDYLWGNPAFAVALLLAQSFSAAGWQMRPGMVPELGPLPLHVFKIDGESRCQPCAETLLTEEAVEHLLQEGFIPLVSFKDRDSVRIARFQSIADPPHILAGRWAK